MSYAARNQALFKPETALKRAEDLITIGQSQSALNDLHEWIVGKKYKTFTEAHETLMTRLIQLAVQ